MTIIIFSVDKVFFFFLFMCVGVYTFNRFINEILGLADAEMACGVIFNYDDHVMCYLHLSMHVMYTFVPIT